jgi:Iron/manganese superoxide dismutases, alpha-hairpin domain/Iron/manganese superoxide dismutases, C-terminal domain
MLFMVCLLFICLPRAARPRAHRRSADTVTLAGRMSPAQWTLVHPDCPRASLRPDMAYKLSPLQFGYDALEPYIDAETMELHHDKHHQAYVDQLNKALETYPQLADLAIDELLGRLYEVPETMRTAVRNNGGGHANHQFFWRILWPNAGGSPKGAIGDAIARDFGSFERFQSLFTDVAVKHFGSGTRTACCCPASRGSSAATCGSTRTT